MKLRLLPAAVQDLAEMHAHIGHDDPEAARRVGRRIGKSLALLAERPDIGRPVADKPVREWSVPGLPYVIPYRIGDDTVDVLRVFHTRRKRPTEWS